MATTVSSSQSRSSDVTVVELWQIGNEPYQSRPRQSQLRAGTVIPFSTKWMARRLLLQLRFNDFEGFLER